MKIKKLKIGIVCYPSIGGSGVVATNLGKALAELGHKVHFISYEQPFDLDLKEKNTYFHKVNINEYPLFKYPDYTLPLAETIAMVHQKYKLDVVHVHYAVPHATAALFAKRIIETSGQTPPKVVTTLHGTDITLLAQDPNLFSVIKFSVERSDAVTAVSQSLKKDTRKILKTNRPIEVIYNFYSPERITRSPKSIRKELKIKDTDFVAIHLSNLRPVKRIPDLLKIAARLKNEPTFKLLILAGGDFNEYLPLVKKLKIGNKIIVKQNVKDIQNYLNAADSGLYTSETESFGMGILETMVYGKPVIAPKVGGIPEVILDKETGYSLKLDDVASFAKIIKILMQDPEKTQRLGQNAAIYAAKKFNAQKIVSEYLNVYLRCCD